MNLPSTLRNAADKEKTIGALSRMTVDYKSRKRKNDEDKPMSLASTFRKPASQGENNGRLITVNW